MLEQSRTIYALVDEENRSGGSIPEILFDGIDVESFANAPHDFEQAAQGNWEPENWMVVVPHEFLKRNFFLDELDAGWYRLKITTAATDNANARSYFESNEGGNLIRIDAVDRAIDSATLDKLNRYSALAGVREAKRGEEWDLVMRAASTDGLKMVVAYDVGQANWNAIVDCSKCPVTAPITELFFDCGMPTGFANKTTPSVILNPFHSALDGAPIILSHWDMDHWAGAALGQPLFGGKGITINWRPEALSRKWIVPNQGSRASGQKISPIAWRLALQLRRKNNLLIWPKSLRFVKMSGEHIIVRCSPKGTINNNNNTGLAFIASESLQSAGPFTLAGADAEYSSIRAKFPSLDKLKFTGLVASHHGGDVVSFPPVPGGWRKMVFSHGAKYGHPTQVSRDLHKDYMWHQQYETHARRTRILANGDQQEIGTTCLGSTLAAIGAALHECENCRAAIANCPIK